MAEQYLDVLTVRLRAYSETPMPEHLTEAMSLSVEVGSQLDLEQLTDEVRQDLAEQQHRIQQTRRETSWGAFSAGVLLEIDVPTWLGALGGVAAFWDVIARRVLSHGRVRKVAGETPAETARTMAAENLNIGVDSIRIVGLEPVGDGHRVNLETPLGPFIFEIDSHGVSRLHKGRDS
jgi:hypothetical protein